MVSCVVPNCKNSSGKASKNKDGITFHRFPRDKQRKKLWDVAVNREEGWSSTPSSTVCSEHFAPNDFNLTESGLRRLASNAIPSINISICQEPEPTICNLDPVKIEPKDSQEVIELRNKVKRLEAIADRRKRKLELKWQETRRTNRKLEYMKYLVEQLIRNEQCKTIQIHCSFEM
ncbi:THAP domain-containing protein 1 [Battus philenor]|uniref:THAP domain-containing protein 1 n=1 Tax=Battus philenor TaxID=42288 RepID=UPI0035CF9488